MLASTSQHQGGVAAHRSMSWCSTTAPRRRVNYAPAQAANQRPARWCRHSVVAGGAAIGPQMSGSARRMARSSAGQPGDRTRLRPPRTYRPENSGQIGKPARRSFPARWTTDAFRAPNMATLFVDTLKANRFMCSTDRGAYGVGNRRCVSAPGREARPQGARPRKPNPKEDRLPTVLTKAKSLNPDALYYAGRQSGFKVVKANQKTSCPRSSAPAAMAATAPRLRRGPGSRRRRALCDDRRADPDRKPRGQAAVERLVKNYQQQQRILRSPPRRGVVS